MSEQPPGGDDDARLRPTGAGLLLGWGLAGLVGGWLVRPVWAWLDGTAPIVTWLQVLALFLVAAILAVTAWATWRTLHVHGNRLEPHRAVNRLVLAKACALTGALVAGGYGGYALSWLGLTEAVLARERVLHSVLAGLAAALLVVGSLLLERACRVRRDPDDRRRRG